MLFFICLSSVFAIQGIKESRLPTLGRGAETAIMIYVMQESDLPTI